MLAVVVVGTLAALMQLRATFDDRAFLVPAAVAALSAALFTVVARSVRLSAGESALLSILGFIGVGIAVVGGGASVVAARVFSSGLSTGWAEFMSATPPIDLTDEFRALPFALAWLGVLVGGELLRVRSHPVVSATGPIIVAVAVALIADGDRQSGLWVGGALVGVALVLSLPILRPSHDAGEALAAAESTGGGRYLGPAISLLVLVGVGAVAVVVGPRLPWVDHDDRTDLRDRRLPVFEPLARPSPLSNLKPSVQPDAAETVVFTVSSVAEPTRLNLAVLDSFDGVVWTVADPDAAGGVEFRPVGSRSPDPTPTDFGTSNTSEVIRAQFEIVDLGAPGLPEVFLPTPGWPLAIDFGSPADVRMNLRTGTAAVPGGLERGVRFTVQTRVSAELTAEQLEAATFAVGPGLPELAPIPAPIRRLRTDLTADAEPGFPIVESVREFFALEGNYSAGVDTAPGHSIERLVRFLIEDSPVVGYEEQYASAAGLILDLSQLEARVVVGYRIPTERYQGSTAEVRAGDISAWVEVRTIEHGWVPIDITPDRSRTPTEEESVAEAEDVAVPNAPPALPPANVLERVEVGAAEEEPAEEDEPEEADDDNISDLVPLPGLSTATIVGVVAALPFVLVGLGAAIVVVIKRRRTKRRRGAVNPGVRVAGAWADVSERFTEAGARSAPTETPSTAARQFAGQLPPDDPVDAELRALVSTVERAAYHRDEPGSALADAAWAHRDAAVATLLSARSRRDRMAMSVDPRPLVGNRRFR